MELTNGARRGQNGAVLRLKIESEITLIYGAEKVVDRRGPEALKEVPRDLTNH